MIKHCRNLLDHVFKKWPMAELYLHDADLIHDSELTIIYQNHWFITVYPSSYRVSIIVYMITGSIKEKNQGFRFIKEYRIGRLSKDGKHLTTCSYCTDSDLLVKVRWSLSDLIENLELEISQSGKARGTNL